MTDKDADSETETPTGRPATLAPVMVPLSRFVLANIASAATGLTVKAMEHLRASGQWIEGRHYRRRNGRIFIDMHAYERWVETGR
jgi:hypothetical protein